MKNYNKLKKIIQKANPDKLECLCGYCGCIDESIKAGGRCQEQFVNKIIRLADVLLALNKNIEDGFLISYCTDNEIHIQENNIDNTDAAIWNLKDDSLDNQSEECKQFLIGLLVK